ncbi:MAG: rhomboid family intramembrane serine protease [Bryobacteraceae bacterium]|jgi:membrane associated rhomboid family serine protease
MIPLRDTERSESPPIVTSLIIVANAIAFFYELSLDPWSRNHLIATFGVVPEHFSYLSLLTSMFLHGGWMHVIGNMWFLWIFGDNVEDILGHVRYLLFYLLCGVAAGLAHIAANAGSHLPAIGASGAIAGVMGAYLVKYPHARILTLVPVFVFLTTFELPAAVVLVYWFVLQIFSGLGSVVYSQISQQGVAWFAHVGGFLAGVVLIWILPTRPRYRLRSELHW